MKEIYEQLTTEDLERLYINKLLKRERIIKHIYAGLKTKPDPKNNYYQNSIKAFTHSSKYSSLRTELAALGKIYKRQLSLK